MSDEPINLDERRKHVDQEVISKRRRKQQESEIVRAAYIEQMSELKDILSKSNSDDFSDFAAKVRFLVSRYSESSHAQGPLQKLLVSSVLKDLERLKRVLNTKPSQE